MIVAKGPHQKGQAKCTCSTNETIRKAAHNERARRYKERQRAIQHTMMETTTKNNVKSSTINLYDLAINLEKSINRYEKIIAHDWL
jgi:cell fate (sporulation/competence/biofilm development) regulator YlbF (YheA/YmcA/DUF963 family)